MANNMIALQARAPQAGNLLAPAISQNAQFINMMMQQKAADRQASLAQQTMDINAKRAAREEALAAPQLEEAQFKASAERIKTSREFLNFSAVALSNAGNAQQLAAFGDRIKQLFPQPEFQKVVDQTIATAPQDPAQFAAWRQGQLRSTLSADQQLKQHFVTQTGENTQRVIAIPEFGGAAHEVEGSQYTTAPKPTYKVDENGNLIAVEGRTAAPVLVGGPRGGAAKSAYGTTIESGAKEIVPGIRVTSRQRTPEGNAAAKGVPGSYHLSDNARDFTPPAGMSMDTLYAKLDKKFGPMGYDVLNEGNHVHIEPGKGMTAGQPVKMPVKGEEAAKKTDPAVIAEVKHLYSLVEDANAKGHILSEGQGYIANRLQEARVGRPWMPGGTAEKTSLDNIDKSAKRIMRSMITKGTSQTLRTNLEQQNFLQSVGGGDSTYETRIDAIRSLAKNLGIALPSKTKVVNGQRYYQIGNHWYDNPEGND